MITGVIDYGAGNLRSVLKAVESLERETRLVRESTDLDGVDALILPGVGAFGDCSTQLHEQSLIEPVRLWIREDRPYLGICLGYQILFEGSEESPGAPGLSAFPGKVVRFPSSALKVPHMGWNAVHPVDEEDALWDGLPEAPHLYFVHSFYPQPADESLVGSRCDYGGSFASSVRKGRVVATQFHPEKSQELGIQLLGNFLQMAEQTGEA